MNFDDIQKAWQRQDDRVQVHVDTQRLLKKVRREDRKFRTELLWRDATEIIVAVLGGMWAIHRALKGNWPNWLILGGLIFVAGFLLLDRLWQRRRKPRLTEPLAAAVEAALQQIEHQIWLLENVFWWYLLPIVAGVTIALGYYAWDLWPWGWLGTVALWGTAALCAIVFKGVYQANQEAVRNELRPRQAELKQLLDNLQHPEGD